MNLTDPAGQASELRTALYPLKPYFWHAQRLTLVSGALTLAPTFYMFAVYGRVLDSRSPMTLFMLTLLVLFAIVVMELLEWARNQTLLIAGHAFSQRLVPRVFQGLFESHLGQGTAVGIQPMNDLGTVREFMHHPALAALMEAPIALLFAAILFMLDPLLGWCAVAGALLQATMCWLNQRSINTPLTEAGRSSIAAQQYADASLRNAEVIESMGMLPHIHQRWHDKQQKFLALQARASDQAGAFMAASKFLQITMGSLLLGLGAWLILRDRLPGGPGMMIVASVLGGRLLTPLVQLVGQWRSVVNARDAWNRLEKMLHNLPAKPAAMALPAPGGHLSVEGVVALAPGGNTQILKGVAFALQPGEVLAVIGPSAAGKTTLARLLVGLWPAAVGKVRLDGADVYSWDKLELGPHMGYLPQGVALLDGTLAENIARFGELRMDKVEAAARAVGLHEFIMSLPQGYDSPVGREGTLLSGGQRQRVALARAVYGEPVLLVLDEPDANLDGAGEAALAQTIHQLRAQHRTIVVISHRTSMLALADKLLLLQDGSQKAFGPRDQVLAGLQQRARERAQQASQGWPPSVVPLPSAAASGAGSPRVAT